MDKELLWYVDMPDVFEREKSILESRGFSLHKHNNIIEFIGKSSVLEEYPLRIIYPNGYPSFPPKVISDVKDELVLKRHQRKLDKTICCFGFSSERWRADFTAREILQEVEELLVNYSPLTFEEKFSISNDYVPEPIVNQYDYGEGSIFIPPPFGDMELTDLQNTNDVLLNYSAGQKRGILRTIVMKSGNAIAHNGYDKWFKDSTVYRAKLYKINSPPPLTTGAIGSWLTENNISINQRKNQFVFFVFEDDWGRKGNKRMTWVALRSLQGYFTWIKCYLVSQDDHNIRTPNGFLLKDKVVTIVGLGSLGSIVSTTLAQEGVSKFNLFDYDIYEPSNAIRHQVDQSWFGLPKVAGVKSRIKALAPMANVNGYEFAVGGNINSAIYQVINQVLTTSDIIIDTTGEHSVSHFLNRYCVTKKIPLIIGSVTNGAWSCEVVKYIPYESGCWGCWNRNHGFRKPPSAPVGEMQFAPGCDQPTFIGGISSVNITGGLVSQAVMDTLLDVDLDKKHYILWSEKDIAGNRNYTVQYINNPALEDCEVCNEN